MVETLLYDNIMYYKVRMLFNLIILGIKELFIIEVDITVLLFQRAKLLQTSNLKLLLSTISNNVLFTVCT